MLLNLLAKILARPAVTDWLIRRARRTPYTSIVKKGELYMERYWLFNPFQPQNDGAGRRWGEWVPSIRLQWILRPDVGPYPHDHPWNARTFILRGWYRDVRKGQSCLRTAGTTATLRFGEFHHIAEVAPGGVWTLFVTYRKRGTWGFQVDGVKVPWREHQANESRTAEQATTGEPT